MYIYTVFYSVYIHLYIHTLYIYYIYIDYCLISLLQVHKCPSQATHVHNLTYTAFKIEDSAQTVEDFGGVLSRKEPVLLY